MKLWRPSTRAVVQGHGQPKGPRYQNVEYLYMASILGIETMVWGRYPVLGYLDPFGPREGRRLMWAYDFYDLACPILVASHLTCSTSVAEGAGTNIMRTEFLFRESSVWLAPSSSPYLNTWNSWVYCQVELKSSTQASCCQVFGRWWIINDFAVMLRKLQTGSKKKMFNRFDMVSGMALCQTPAVPSHLLIISGP